MPPRKSKYSEFFEFNGQNATCKTCGETIKRTSGSTSGLKYHLEEIHGKKSQSDEVENAGPAPKKAKSDDDGQKVMDDFYKVTGKEPLEDLVAREDVMELLLVTLVKVTSSKRDSILWVTKHQTTIIL